jgi:hypothetical protein
MILDARENAGRQGRRPPANFEERKQRITETVRNRLSWRGWSKFSSFLRGKSC